MSVAASLTVLLTVGMFGVSGADVTKQDLQAAQAKVAALNEHLSQIVEQYDAAVIELQALEQRMADAQEAADAADRAFSDARALLSERAAKAYEGQSSALEVLLGSTTFSDFSDRLAYLSRSAQLDADAAAQATLLGEKAKRKADDLALAVGDHQVLLRSLNAKKAEIEAGIAEQEGLVAQIQSDLARQQAAAAAAAAKAAAAAQQQQQQQQQQPPSGGGSGGGSEHDPSPPPPPPPPPPSHGAAGAIAAAKSVIGVPYKWGGASPSEGFDCSGLTMWSWAQVGVSLPHSSAAQYTVIPHVSKDNLQPGDLLFFYTPIHHVAMYLGGNQMIHADHPGSTVHIETISSYYWAVYVGAGRPG